MVNRCQVLAIGAHPDDVELGCGGTVARLAAAGRAVGLLDLTAGEMATRGDPATRAAEAAAAAVALGVAWRECLGLPDGGLDADDPGQRRAVVAALRSARPGVILVHHWGDPHPDHRAAAGLVGAAAFLAGVARYGGGGAGPRPGLVLAYPGPRQLLAAQIVVDVTATYAAKGAALRAHRSQFDPGWQPAAGQAPVTHLTSAAFLAAVEGRDRAAGNTIGCELGEGFVAVGPVSVDAVAGIFAAVGGRAGTVGDA